ncbi:hypothetical protein [Castellaniella sp.]|uniref:hypothetical protein n=1 Tax=Castellaniella sp. TaxID=1955812 RepID=UPI002AFEF42F|nr:hypothetical protein [Castellaniella sp.]
MTTQNCQQVREHVLGFMGSLPGPGQDKDEEVVQRADGVREFGRQWLVHKDEDGASLSASLSDRDDVIEFGLLAREGDTAINILHATLVLDEDEILLNVLSEAHTDFNFDARLNADRLTRLQETLQFYAAHLAAWGSAPSTAKH